jgi:hypothetical protein
MLEVVEATKQRSPMQATGYQGGVLEDVLDALRSSPNILKIRTVLFAPAKFVKDLNGCLYNRMARNPISHLRSKMTDEEEFTARSPLKWPREGDRWTLLHRRRRMSRVVPGKDRPAKQRVFPVEIVARVFKCSEAHKCLRSNSRTYDGRPSD